MELLIFGHAGPPMIVFPSSMGAFFEYEDRGMVGALAHKLEHGALQLFCVSSVDSESWYNRRAHPRDRIRRHLQYEDYLLGRSGSAGPSRQPAPTHRRHRLQLRRLPRDGDWRCAIRTRSRRASRMSGAFDICQFLDGYYDEDCYFLNPPRSCRNLSDAYYLDQYRRNKWVLATGEQDICRGRTKSFSGLLHPKGIPHSLHVWGFGSKHDWPDWRPMAAPTFRSSRCQAVHGVRLSVRPRTCGRYAERSPEP